jgi:hypothetical protein
MPIFNLPQTMGFRQGWETRVGQFSCLQYLLFILWLVHTLSLKLSGGAAPLLAGSPFLSEMMFDNHDSLVRQHGNFV